jgi:hypothetical protein
LELLPGEPAGDVDEVGDGEARETRGDACIIRLLLLSLLLGVNDIEVIGT